MNLNIRYRHLPLTHAIDRVIEEKVLALASRHPLHEVSALVERRMEASPRFLVHLHVAVPGPDLRVECADHTVSRALDRVLSLVEHKLAQRVAKRRSVSRHRGLRPPGRLGSRS